MKKSETSGLLLVSGVMVYWGFTTVMMKHALVYMSSATYIMARFLVASVPLLILYGRKLKGSLSKKLLLHGCILGVLEMIPMQTSTLALHYTSAANSVFVSQLSFVFVPLMQCLLSRKLPSRTLLITIAWLLGGAVGFRRCVPQWNRHGNLAQCDLRAVPLRQHSVSEAVRRLR